MKKINVAILVVVIGVLGVASIYLSGPPGKAEHLSQLVSEIRPWCSRYHLDNRRIVTSRANLPQLEETTSPSWLVSGVEAATYCTRGSSTGPMLLVLTFPTSVKENAWLNNDSQGEFQLLHSSVPNPVFVGLGWVAVLGWNTIWSRASEGAVLHRLYRALKTDYRSAGFNPVHF
jgi:hypothetical protein